MNLPLVILTVVTLMHCGSVSGAVTIYHGIRWVCYDALCSDYPKPIDCYLEYQPHGMWLWACEILMPDVESRCTSIFLRNLRCSCGETSLNCFPTPAPPTTTVDPWTGFPTRDFMIKHEQSGLCVSFIHRYPMLKKCKSNNRRQHWFNDGNYIKSRWYRHPYGLFMEDYNSQRNKTGNAAIGDVRLKPPNKNRDQLYQWEYTNKFLTVRVPFSPRLIPWEFAGGTMVSAAGAVDQPLGCKSMEAATAEDERRMKWLLIPRRENSYHFVV